MSPPSWPAGLAALVLACGVAQAGTAFEGRWFSPASPFNTPVGDAPEAPYSARAVAAFLHSGEQVNYYQDLWTVAVVASDGVSDPRRDLHYSWDPDSTWVLRGVPMAPGLLAYARWLDTQTYDGTRLDWDGRVCLYDGARRGFFSLWNTRIDNGDTAVAVRAGGFSPEDGPGAAADGTAAKVSYCAGLVRPQEIASGHIDHALAMVWPVSLVRSSALAGATVFPASATDGEGTDPTAAVPMGARLQLDPTLGDARLRALGLDSPADLAVAHALQRYGAYVVDTGPGAGFLLQNAFGQGRTVYPGLGRGEYGMGRHRVMQAALVPHLRFVAPPPEVPLDRPSAEQTSP